MPPRLRAPRHSARERARGHRRVRALRLLPSGVPDVSHARGRERQSARPHRADARAARGHAAPDDESVETHIDQCLGCRACETACPSGVPYGHLLEATRATLAEHRPIPLVARVILFVFERPWLLRLAMLGGRVMRATGIARLLSRLPGRARLRDGDAERRRAPLPRADDARAPSDRTGERGTVALLTGCVMEGLFAETNRATERALSANGYALSPTRRASGAAARCTRTPATRTRARRLARANIAAFERAERRLHLRQRGRMRRDDEGVRSSARRRSRVARARGRGSSRKVRDVSELLVGGAGRRAGGACAMRVAYDAPCHLLHAQRVSARRSTCCAPFRGSSSCRSTRARCAAAAPGSTTSSSRTCRTSSRTQAREHRGGGAEVVATGNPGCMMQIGAGLVAHRLDGRGRSSSRLARRELREPWQSTVTTQESTKMSSGPRRQLRANAEERL